jgi:hypothetical protein
VKSTALAFVLILIDVATGSVAVAQQGVTSQYAVKFVCGKPPVVVGRVPPVAPGTYYTAINVHNPADRSVGFRKKFVVALPGDSVGEIRGFFPGKLGPDRAVEIDCQEIFNAFARWPFPPVPPISRLPRPGFLKGFAVVELADSAGSLDVVGVYTAAGSTGLVDALEIERVPARRIALTVADLIPVPDSGRGFCVRDSAGRLLVTVRNAGSGGAPASATTVHFGNGTTVSLPTPPIPAGGSVTLAPVAIPSACFHPDCSFRIVVDATGVVVESDETNNVAVGQCLG